MVTRHTGTHVEVEIHARLRRYKWRSSGSKGGQLGGKNLLHGRWVGAGAFTAGGAFQSDGGAFGGFSGAATPGANDYDPGLRVVRHRWVEVSPGGAWDADAFATPAGGDVWSDNTGGREVLPAQLGFKHVFRSAWAECHEPIFNDAPEE